MNNTIATLRLAGTTVKLYLFQADFFKIKLGLCFTMESRIGYYDRGSIPAFTTRQCFYIQYYLVGTGFRVRMRWINRVACWHTGAIAK